MDGKVLGGAAFGALLLLAAGAHAACSPIPFVFQPGTPWNASQVNDNFTAVINCANSSTGNMRGPNPSTSGAAVIWDSTDGTLTANTAMDGYSSVMAVPPGVIAGLVPGWNTTSGIGFRKRAATSTDGNNVLIARDAQFTGGAPGFVNAALQVATHTVPGINSYEWAGLFYIDNNGTQADGSQDNALYARALKKTTGSTWAATFELDDYNSGVASGSPVAVEMDVYANGADPSSNRTILHLVGNKLDSGGTTPDINAALKIGDPGASASFTRGIWFAGNTLIAGIDFRDATFSSAGIWLKDNTSVNWDTAGAAKTFWDTATSTVRTDSPTTIDGAVGVSALTLRGTMAAGLDLRSGTYSSAAIWLKDNAPVSWSTDGVAKSFYDSGSNTVRTVYPVSIAGIAGVAAITVLDGTGAVATGLDLRLGTYSSAAIWLQDNKPINWDTAGTKQTFWDTATSTVKTVGDATVTGFMNAASYKVAGTAGVTGATCSAWTSGICTAP